MADSEKTTFKIRQPAPPAPTHGPAGAPAPGPAGAGPGDALARVARMVAVGSGKGGVGKSTVAVNLAVALARMGARVGLLDADIYGPSVPLMMGVHEKPEVEEARLVPLRSHGVSLMSLGFLLPDHSAPVVWRGPMVAQAVQQMLNDVEWGELDCLLIDLPPGTGDAALTLAQVIPLSGAIIVMTPQEVAVQIATKTLNMFRSLKVPILGVVENMSYLKCDRCGTEISLFGKGGAKRASSVLGVPFLGAVPIEAAIAECGDRGKPLVIANPESDSARVFERIAAELARELGLEVAQR